MTNKQSVESRLTRLEAAVFGKDEVKVELKKNEGKFEGPSGGLKLLISRGAFGTKKALAATKKELEEAGYHYSLQAVNTALRRLAKPGGPLVALKENGKNVYIIRK